ncbi:MAG: LLM class F420-dependent oxidoreductase [Actinobacteria bacterium]|nr:LLM class F420-dependent oxidoreductase [Actinomycetota bacterium]
MKLGLGLDTWSSPRLELPLERVRLAERLGFDSVWTAEIYGADAITPLAFLAARTSRIRLGSGIAQVAARPPTTTAMQFGTLEAMATGRVICGLGLSGPQVVEGWYGQPWTRPNQTLREYVDVVRQVFRREAPVAINGEILHLPHDGPEGLGVGRPLKPILHMNPDLPIFLAAGGPRNVRLAFEVADGWIPLGYTPGSAHLYADDIAAGLDAGGRTIADVEIQASARLVLTDDVRATLDAARPQTAMLVGGYGTDDHNFHRDAMVRRGFGEEAARIHELFAAGRRDEAAAAVPDDYLDDGALIGDEQRIRSKWASWEASDATGLTVRPGSDDEMRLLADIAGCEPRPGS